MPINIKRPAWVWMEDLLFVVTPNSISVKNNNQNESTQSVDGTPITFLKRDKAQTFTLSFMIPFLMEHYKEIYYTNEYSSIRNVKDFTDFLWRLKWTRSPFRFTIEYAEDVSFNGMFILDDYEYTQDATNGSDYEFTITMTEYYPAHNYEVSGQLINSLIEHGIRNPRRLD